MKPVSFSKLKIGDEFIYRGVRYRKTTAQSARNAKNRGDRYLNGGAQVYPCPDGSIVAWLIEHQPESWVDPTESDNIIVGRRLGATRGWCPLAEKVHPELAEAVVGLLALLRENMGMK